jgi:hypothetical protein
MLNQISVVIYPYENIAWILGPDPFALRKRHMIKALHDSSFLFPA